MRDDQFEEERDRQRIVRAVVAAAIVGFLALVPATILVESLSLPGYIRQLLATPAAVLAAIVVWRRRT